MHIFRLWAPRASRADVHFHQESQPMSAMDAGWWEARVHDAGAGADYSFSVNGENPVPDPRSYYQPHGVHGCSRILGETFRWSDQHWNAPPISSAIIYELHVGTFTTEGTFQAAIGKLDHLVELGVTHVELMPVAEFPGPWGWGYDGVDLFAPQHHYGTPEDLKGLVNACHERGLAVLLDVVYNHFGPDGNYLDRFAPYTTDQYHTPWGKAVNLDGPLSDGVREFFLSNAVHWLRDYHFDGLRLDAVHAIIDNSAYHFLEALADRVSELEIELGRHLVLIAESDRNDPRLIRSREIGGYGLDAQWADDFHHALHALLTGEQSGYYIDFGSLEQLASALRQAFVYDGCFSVYRQRRHGRKPLGIPSQRFIVFTQNHDQVGNRAKGERLSQLVNASKLRLAAALLFTSPFVPLIFQGEEWAASSPFLYFTQHEDAQLGRAVSEGRRREFSAFGWAPDEVPDPQDPETFQRSKLNWEELQQTEHGQMLEWYRSLIRMRRRFLNSSEAASGGTRDAQVQCSETEKWLLMTRGEIQVACNFGPDPWLVPVATGAEVLLTSSGLAPTGSGQIVVAPESAIVLRQSARSHVKEDPVQLKGMNA